MADKPNLELTRKQNFLGLLTRIRIKNHFPLEGPNDLSYLNLHLSSELTTVYYVLLKVSDVSSANNLGFETKFSGKTYVLRKVMVQELNLEGLLLQHLPMLNVGH